MTDYNKLLDDMKKISNNILKVLEIGEKKANFRMNKKRLRKKI